MQEVHAILLTGGSAFGLAAADGVMKFLEERNRGYATPWARVPIVPAAVVFDLNLGSSSVRPDAHAGYQACENASSTIACGNVGAGTGATVGKWAGRETWMKGGVGAAYISDGDLQVGAIAVVNAVGDIIDEHGGVLAGARSQDGTFLALNNPYRTLARGKVLSDTNTTLVVIMTNALFTKVDVLRVAQRAHDGMARAIVPVHTSYDGDIAFAVAAGSVKAPLDLVAEIGAALTAESIRTAVRSAASLPGVLGLKTV
jgi:L-aminopeptidase/D-esterase-like protein